MKYLKVIILLMMVLLVTSCASSKEIFKEQLEKVEKVEEKNENGIKNYVGKDYNIAKSELEDLGYDVVIIKNDSGKGKKDKVVSQEIGEYGEIILTIPKTLTTYPDFKFGEYELEEIMDFADSYGLYLDISYEKNNAFKSGTIYSQSREKGTTIIKGQTLKILIAE